MNKKIIAFSPARKKYNSGKRGCTCYSRINMAKHEDRAPEYELDMKNHIVLCMICHKEVNPWEAIVTFSDYWERIEQQEEMAYEWILEAEKYKPWRRAMKDIERNIGRKGDMIPVCPHCGEGFLLEEVRGYMNRQLYKPDKEEK